MCILHSFIYSFMNCAVILLIVSPSKEENSWNIIYFLKIHSWLVIEPSLIDLQSATWRPRKAKGVSSSPEAGKDQWPSSGQSDRKSSLWLAGGSAFLFYSGLRLIGQGPPTLRRPICFTQSSDSNINLTPKPHRHTQDKVQPNIWVPMAQSSQHIKFSSTGAQTDDEAKKHVSVGGTAWVFRMARNLRGKPPFVKRSMTVCQGLSLAAGASSISVLGGLKGREQMPWGAVFNQWWLGIGRQIPQLPHPSHQTNPVYVLYHLAEDLG